MATTPHTTSMVQELTRPVWRIILVCLVVTVMEGYNVIVFGSVIPLILADPGMGVTSEGIGLIGSMTYIGMFLGGTTAGFLGDRYGRKRLLIIVICVFFAGAMLSGLAAGPVMLAVARLVAGLGVGGAITMSLALASSGAPSRDAGTVVTVIMAGIPLGGAIASLLGMPVLPVFGWRAMFLIGAALTLLILFVVLRSTLEVVSAKAPQTLSRRVTLLSLFHERGAALVLLISAIAVPTMFVWYGINTWLVDAMTELHVPLTSALLFGFVLSGGAIIGSFLIMRWADRWGVAKVGTVMSALTVVGLTALAFGPRDLGFALGAVALIGAGGQSTINLLQAAVSTFFPPQMRATSLGWSNGVSYIGAITGPAAGGFVLGSAAGPIGVFVLFAAVGTLVVIATFVLALWASATHGHPGRQRAGEEPSR
ncbi:MFS transporter [Microbacterium maritypicum]|uniref:MFS transporter n=1 Tax=Microbacterium maritypicum TaxID=33918 RepID=UPI00381CF89C